jgi:hypothetical protein
MEALMAVYWSRQRAKAGDRVKITGHSLWGGKGEEGIVKSVDRYGYAHVLSDGYLDTIYVQLKRLRVRKEKI